MLPPHILSIHLSLENGKKIIHWKPTTATGFLGSLGSPCQWFSEEVKSCTSETDWCRSFPEKMYWSFESESIQTLSLCPIITACNWNFHVRFSWFISSQKQRVKPFWLYSNLHIPFAHSGVSWSSKAALLIHLAYSVAVSLQEEVGLCPETQSGHAWIQNLKECAPILGKIYLGLCASKSMKMHVLFFEQPPSNLTSSQENIIRILAACLLWFL